MTISQATYHRAARAAEQLVPDQIRGGTIYRGQAAARRGRQMVRHPERPAVYDTSGENCYTLDGVTTPRQARTTSTVPGAPRGRRLKPPTKSQPSAPADVAEQLEHKDDTGDDSPRRSEETYAAAAEAAEQLDPAQIRGGTIYRGKAAAARGREIVAEATARPGRPNLDPEAAPGQRSRLYALRLPAPLTGELDGFLEAHPGENFSSVMRQALQAYLQDPTANDEASARSTRRSQGLREDLAFYQAHPAELDRAIKLLSGLLSEALDVSDSQP